MPDAYVREVGAYAPNVFLIDLHSILENTKPNSADYDSAVTDLADTVFTSGDYEDVLDYIERLLIREGKNSRITFTAFYLLSVTIQAGL